MPWNEEERLNRIDKHKSEFETKAKAIHDGVYRYNLDTYKSPHIKMEIICHIHGRFLQKPYDHLHGKGCKRCAVATRAKEQVLSTDTFVSKANVRHNNKYNYDKTTYISARRSVTITCPIHGDFEQNASQHLAGVACTECGKNARLNSVRKVTEDFLKEAIRIHGNTYDYSKTVYRHCEEKVIITCSIHGDFHQRPSGHLNGRGCVKCAHMKSSLNYTRSIEEFITKAKLKHGDTYSYSNVNYTNSNDKVSITCPTHGDFLQTPSTHLQGRGCRKCASEKRSFTTQEFINRSKDIHGERYDYRDTVYTGCYNDVQINCKVHGIFRQQANSHIRGTGCPQCAESKGERDVTFVLNKYGITYIKQYMLPGNLYKYDFYLPEYNVFIEYHGVQHYRRISYFHRDETDFDQQRVRDYFKQELIKHHKGRLIVIPYTFNTRDKVEEKLRPYLKKLIEKVY